MNIDDNDDDVNEFSNAINEYGSGVDEGEEVIGGLGNSVTHNNTPSNDSFDTLETNFGDDILSYESASQQQAENNSSDKESYAFSNNAAVSSAKNDTSHDGTSKTETEDNSDDVIQTTEDEKKDLKFSAQKISAAAANLCNKPKQLNKKVLLSGVILLFGGVFLITFLTPTKGQKGTKKEKPVAQQQQLRDYSTIARPPEEEKPSTSYPANPGDNSANANRSDEVEIPPIIPPKDTAAPYSAPQRTTNGTQTGTAIQIPDTRNDRLQGKPISGIKGISSTQKNYQTDYDATMAKNTSSARPTSSYELPSKDEYIKNTLEAYSTFNKGSNAYATQNDQEGKNNFFNKGRDSSDGGQWLGLNTIWEGTIFEAVLTSELNTDLPGEITARIAKNIYSSQDGRYLLIPQNSILYGSYNSSISYAQSRVQVSWNTLIRPDGYRVSLGNFNGTDAKGASGLEGHVNDHPLAYLKAIALMSTFSIMNTEFASATADSDNEYVQNIMANTQQITNELADKLIDRAMNVQPTIKIKAGTKINVVANKTMSLPPCDLIPVTQPYRKH